GILKEISAKFPGLLLWSDTGTYFCQKTLENLPELLKSFDGLISPISHDKMPRWTHPGVYKYFKDDGKKYDNVTNCSTGAVFLDTNKTQHIIDKLYKSPQRSSRKNHRQEQAIFTYFVTNDNRKCNMDAMDLDIVYHEFDRLCDGENYIEQLVKPLNQS
ncbi:7769_t:CDS:2, partial [Racocetra fulgida]